jgi:hypothetical protein
MVSPNPLPTIVFSSLAHQNQQTVPLSLFTLTTFSYSSNRQSCHPARHRLPNSQWILSNVSLAWILFDPIYIPFISPTAVSTLNVFSLNSTWKLAILHEYLSSQLFQQNSTWRSTRRYNTILRYITGLTIHLAIYTRPDIIFAASKLAQFNSNPSMQHYRAGKNLVRYIQGSKDLVIIFYRSPSSICLRLCHCLCTYRIEQCKQQTPTTANLSSS